MEAESSFKKLYYLLTYFVSQTIVVKVPFLKTLKFFYEHVQYFTTYPEKTVEYSYTISVLLEFSGAEF